MQPTCLYENKTQKSIICSNIIKKREQFEYKLARPQKEIVDYLDYIRYERSLVKLILERNPREHKLHNLTNQRIKGLYNQSTKRFPNRKSLWDEYFVFISTMAKSDNSEVSAVLDNTILHHGHHVENWLKYIKWERAIHTNETKIRNLLMKALQNHPKSEHLYIEFLDVELSNDRESPVVTVVDNATLLYNNAMKNYRSDKSFTIEKILTFQAAVLDQLEKYPFTKTMQLMVLQDYDDNYLTKELFWHILAQRELNGQITLDKNRNKQLNDTDPTIESKKGNIKRCVQVYEGALSKVSLISFHVSYVRGQGNFNGTTLILFC